MRLLFLAILLTSVATAQVKFKDVTFSSDSTFKQFKNKLDSINRVKDFNFTDFVFDGNYFLVSRVLSIGRPRLYVSSFNFTLIYK